MGGSFVSQWLSSSITSHIRMTPDVRKKADVSSIGFAVP
jgi:hypothetical protein